MAVHESPFYALPDFDELIEKLSKIRPKIDASYEQVEKALTNPYENDARLSAFVHLGLLIDSTTLALTFINKHLLPLNNSWWQEVYKPPFESFNDYHKSISINSFNNAFIKSAFLQTLLSTLDNHFRIFLRQIDPVACDGGAGQFANIYAALKSRITSFPAGSDDLINLLRIARNTVHNNGVYFHKSGTNEQITYKGIVYNFAIGMPMDFVTWEWLIEILDDVQELLNKVVFDPQIIGVASEIIDPFSANKTVISN